MRWYEMMGKWFDVADLTLKGLFAFTSGKKTELTEQERERENSMSLPG